MDPGMDIAEETAAMVTHLFARCRFGSALRTLALALLLSSAVAPATFADRTGGSGESPSTSESAPECGAATDDSTQTQPLGADSAGGSDADAPDDIVPPHPFIGRPR
jgi:hypothetical protein